MNSADILQISQQLRQSGMQAIDIRDASTRLRLVTRASAPVAVAVSQSVNSSKCATSDEKTVVRSNALGIARFRHPAQAGGTALVAGTKVEAGAPAMYLESRGILKSIESPVSGEITQVLVVDGDKVDFGKPLFTVKAQA
ncbi:MAG: biotin/lipoyl-binding protein [Burkholderiaceae bacterium]|jgi:acetyl-CoA carboxylase biotin carboxyl carrier protein|nr:biotin/lipoyl-binding protein [Burkholderiaceae bacterium]